jgi:hypothetical protein
MSLFQQTGHKKNHWSDCLLLFLKDTFCKNTYLSVQFLKICLAILKLQISTFEKQSLERMHGNSSIQESSQLLYISW